MPLQIQGRRLYLGILPGISEWNEWKKGYDGTWVRYWMTTMISTAQCGLLISIYEKTWKSTLPAFVSHPLCLAVALYQGRDYHGVTKSIGLSHGISVGLVTALLAKLVFIDKSINKEDTPLTYYWSLAQMTIFGVCTVLDLTDAVQWYILGNRSVTRSDATVADFQSKGYLKKNVGRTQWIMRYWQKVDPDTDEYGFIQPEMQEREE